MRRLVIVGAGAIGGSVGALLHESGTPVRLVARGRHLAAMQEHGLRVRLPDREFTATPECVGSVAAVDWRSDDIAVLATKLQDAAAILDELYEVAGPELPVVCLVNGVDGERMAAARFHTVLSTMVWMPATFLVPGEVRVHAAPCHGVLDTGVVAGAAGTSAGFVCARFVTSRFGAAGFDAVERPDIARWKAAKWITNLGGVAQALVLDDGPSVAAAAQAEGRRVLAAAGVDRVPDEEFAARVQHVGCRPVGGQPREGGSTWQSFERGRPLETPWIEGRLARLAAEHDLPAPINARLAELARLGERVPAAAILGRA